MVGPDKKVVEIEASSTTHRIECGGDDSLVRPIAIFGTCGHGSKRVNIAVYLGPFAARVDYSF